MTYLSPSFFWGISASSIFLRVASSLRPLKSYWYTYWSLTYNLRDASSWYPMGKYNMSAVRRWYHWGIMVHARHGTIAHLCDLHSSSLFCGHWFSLTFVSSVFRWTPLVPLPLSISWVLLAPKSLPPATIKTVKIDRKGHIYCSLGRAITRKIKIAIFYDYLLRNVTFLVDLGRFQIWYETTSAT